MVSYISALDVNRYAAPKALRPSLNLIPRTVEPCVGRDGLRCFLNRRHLAFRAFGRSGEAGLLRDEWAVAGGHGGKQGGLVRRMNGARGATARARDIGGLRVASRR